MIQLLTILGSDGRPLVQQKLQEPSVYLDTWAIRAFAETPALGARFRAALLGTGGTLVVSTLSLVDFAALTDPRHTEAAGRFIDTLMPHVFFSRFEPFGIRNREYALISGIRSGSPFGDEAMLALFAEVSVLRGQLSVQQFFSQVYKHRDRVKGFRESLEQAVLEGMLKLREYADEKPGVRKDMRNPLKCAARPRSTHALMRILFAEIEAAKELPKDMNSFIDLFHAIAPAAYCTYVLVDGQWDARLRGAKKRIEEAGLTARVATTYSKRGDGLELFLQDLESRGAAAPAA